MSPAVVECGALWTRILHAGAAEPDVGPAPDGPVEPHLRGRLARLAIPHEPLAFVVPDRWLAGERLGVLEHERFRAELRSFSELTWYGRSPAVAALAAERYGPGLYLVCDLGWSGASLGLCLVEGRTVRVLATVFEPRAGGGAYAQAVTAGMPAGVRAGFAAAQVAKADRARAVLARATGEHADDPVYVVGGVTISAGRLIECFAPPAELLAARVRDLHRPGCTLLLSGGFGDFPLVEPALPGPVRRMGPEASLHGARLLDRRDFVMASGARREVALPMHRIRNGLLDTLQIPLAQGPGAYAALGRDPLVISDAEDGPGGALHVPGGRLALTVGGRPGAVAVPAGTYRVGLRVSFTGSAALLLDPPAGEPVLVPLDGWEPA
ncbi:hypothetical protein ACFVH6_41445 [Spirillospora sp. NPDC127200]